MCVCVCVCVCVCCAFVGLDNKLYKMHGTYITIWSTLLNSQETNYGNTNKALLTVICFKFSKYRNGNNLIVIDFPR